LSELNIATLFTHLTTNVESTFRSKTSWEPLPRPSTSNNSECWKDLPA